MLNRLYLMSVLELSQKIFLEEDSMNGLGILVVKIDHVFTSDLYLLMDLL